MKITLLQLPYYLISISYMCVNTLINIKVYIRKCILKSTYFANNFTKLFYLNLSDIR